MDFITRQGLTFGYRIKMGIGTFSSTEFFSSVFLKEVFVKVFSLRVHVHDNANELRVENANELKS